MDIAANPIEPVAAERVCVRRAGWNRHVERRFARLFVAHVHVVQRVVAVAELHRLPGPHEQQFRAEHLTDLIHHGRFGLRRKGSRRSRFEDDDDSAAGIWNRRSADDLTGRGAG